MKKEFQAGTDAQSSTTADNSTSASVVSKPSVMRRFPQPQEVDKWLLEKLKEKRINDEFGWTGEYRLCQKDLVDFFIDHTDNKLVEKQQEYIKLLTDELSDVVSMAFVHGWRSNRFEVGKKLREEIASLNGA
jgi:hypothetical protein